MDETTTDYRRARRSASAAVSVAFGLLAVAAAVASWVGAFSYDHSGGESVPVAAILAAGAALTLCGLVTGFLAWWNGPLRDPPRLGLALSVVALVMLAPIWLVALLGLLLRHGMH